MTFEEGTCAAWLHDLLKPHVTQVLVCDPRKNNLGKSWEQERSQRCTRVGELLYSGNLKSVYHGEYGMRTLKELARSYLAITRDLTRVMSRFIEAGGLLVLATRCTHPATVQNG